MTEKSADGQQPPEERGATMWKRFIKSGKSQEEKPWNCNLLRPKCEYTCQPVPLFEIFTAYMSASLLLQGKPNQEEIVLNILPVYYEGKI